MKSLTNRWNQKLAVGTRVSISHPRGGQFTGTIVRLETTGEFCRAYGPRVYLDSGATCTPDDCTPAPIVVSLPIVS